MECSWSIIADFGSVDGGSKALHENPPGATYFLKVYKDNIITKINERRK